MNSLVDLVFLLWRDQARPQDYKLYCKHLNVFLNDSFFLNVNV